MYGRSHKDYDCYVSEKMTPIIPKLIMQSQTSDSDPKRL